MVTRFEVHIGDDVLEDLRARLTRVRWPDELHDAGWSYGASVPFMQRLVDHWLHRFDWRAVERRINAVPQFVADVDGIPIHFVHVRGVGPAPLPLVISHGWPSTFAEMLPLVGPLTDPASHGGDARDAFDLVIPSLPGFGFSGWPRTRGLIVVERYFRALMTDVLGYARFAAHGCDVGARITSRLGRDHADVVCGIHLGTVDLEWPDPLPETPVIRDYAARVARWDKEEGGYAHVQQTYPQTLAFGLHDSPVGLAAWMVDKFRAWSDCGGDIESRFTLDELLTHITIYWATGTIGPSMRRYYEIAHAPPPRGRRIEVPTGIAMFPGERELVVPRELAELSYNVISWTDMPRGGHFPALEEPALLIEDLRSTFRRVRPV